jgi:hypothetical protein
LTGDRKPFPYLQTEANETSGQFSPDEKWVAYVSNESGRNEVYIQSFPTPGGKRQVSTNGGVAPRWRRDGKEIFYVSADRKMMAVSVRGENPLEVGVPAPLFLVQIIDANTTPSSRASYAVSSDGRRFLVDLPAQMGRYYTVMMNWASGVRRR